MEIKITGRQYELTNIKRYRDPATTITLSYVKFANGIAYVVTYHDDPKFFDTLAEALVDLKSVLTTEELIRLMQVLD